MRVETVVLCDQVILDAVTRKPSLIGIFDRIGVSSFPSIHPHLFMYARVVGNPGERVRVKFQIINPRGDRLENPMPEQTINQAGRLDVFGEIVGLPLDSPGDHRFVVVLNDEVTGEAVCQVVPLTGGGDAGQRAH